MEKYVCIHGHFYQPPRENPWLERIEIQDSAYPYHDWNERITAECFGPNASSRILDDKGLIVRIVNNYSKISFNFGPTLISWLKAEAPEVYAAILEADRESQKHFSGHGSALAQPYNHMIMPLANREDKYTQIIWGIRDFEACFERVPEGMWLPETAVDLETLTIMAQLGIKFTILSPYQAHRVRKSGERSWHSVTGGAIDITMPYRLRLPSGGSITLFFYDGPTSRAVAFEGLLRSGEEFARRLVSGFSDKAGRLQLSHIATDGETYGHHHRYGDMALAYAIHHIESHKLARLTNYGEYLEKFPPTHEVEISPHTSWSCAHGVERWKSNCGCATGGHPGWNQSWRKPLRESLDWLRDYVAPLYQETASQYFKDPWAVRNDYIDVILDRSPEKVNLFLSKHALRRLTADERLNVLKLLELQRHAMLMYTSCGWFFDEISGIETVQVLNYAGRVVQLARELLETDPEPGFLEILGKAKSNVSEHREGRHIYETFVKPTRLDLPKVGAHYALSSLFEDYPERTSIYCYTAERQDYQSFVVGKTKLAAGRVQITSEITGESAHLTFGVIHFGDHNLNGGVRQFRGKEAYQQLIAEMETLFSGADLSEIIRLFDRHFGSSTYSLRSLFRDEQRKVANRILESPLNEVEEEYRRFYQHYALLMNYLLEIDIPVPRLFRITAEVVLNRDLRRLLESSQLDIERLQSALQEAQTRKIPLDTEGLSYLFKGKLEALMERFAKKPAELPLLLELRILAGLRSSLPFDVDVWKVQNIYYRLLQKVYPDFRGKAEEGGPSSASAREWIVHFLALGERLSIKVG